MNDGRESAPQDLCPLDAALDRLRDAVTPIERTERVPVTSAVGRVLAADVAPAGEDPASIHAGKRDPVLQAGRRLRQSDLGVCRNVGTSRVEVVARPTVGVLPVADKLFDDGLSNGGQTGLDTVAADGLIVSSLVEAWGGKPTSRDPVERDPHTLRTAIQRDLTRDVVVATGGTATDCDGVLAGVVEDLGTELVDGIAMDPDRDAAVGLVRETPVVVLPASPVACLATAVRIARPAVKRLGRLPVRGHPETTASLDSTVESETGIRTVVPVSLAGETETVTATPLPRDGAAPVSTIARADGWVAVPEAREELPAGETITVRDWEYQL